VRVVEGVSVAGPVNPLYSSAPTGTLIYLPVGASTKRSLTWVDREGRTVGTVAIAPRHFEQPRISPDGSRVLVATREPGAQDVLLVDLSRGVATRFSSSPAEDETPVWSAAGTHVFFKSAPELRQKPSDGSGAEEPLDDPQFELQERFNRNAHLSSASPDGKHLALNAVSGVTGEDVEIMPLGPGGTLVKFAASEANELAPRFSPDGRWVAYQSDESGQPEIYVQAFPGPGGKWQVSKAGGTEPVWARSGTELFYRAGRAFMSVPVGTSPTFTPGSPTQLFEGSFETGHRFHPNYDVAPDGRRFLVITRDGQQPGVSVHVEIDLHGELRRLAPRPQ
jgi:serine/threonine-protein kinase